MGLHYNTFDLLRVDHMKVETLALQLRLSRDANTQRRLLDEINTLLGRHMQLEEEIFYPACAQIPRLSRLVDHSHTDHQLAKNAIKDLAVLNPSTGQYKSLVTKLIIELEKHVREEEELLFFGIRRYMPRSDFKRLNRDFIRAYYGGLEVTRKAA
jgi:iron-sulfur cluster repair protein YtfE (RIC family)